MISNTRLATNASVTPFATRWFTLASTPASTSPPEFVISTIFRACSLTRSAALHSRRETEASGSLQDDGGVIGREFARRTCRYADDGEREAMTASGVEVRESDRSF